MAKPTLPPNLIKPTFVPSNGTISYTIISIMATFEKHCRESLSLFGQPYEEIHLWLDEFQGREPYKMRHRRLRHHEAGIRQAVDLFGPDAEAVARRHIMTDLQWGRVGRIRIPSPGTRPILFG